MDEESVRFWSEFLEWGPRQQQVLATFFAEIDDGLGFVTRAGDVNDDSFAKNGVFDGVTDPQTNILAVRGLWWSLYYRTASSHGGINLPFAELIIGIK